MGRFCMRIGGGCRGARTPHSADHRVNPCWPEDQQSGGLRIVQGGTSARRWKACLIAFSPGSGKYDYSGVLEHHTLLRATAARPLGYGGLEGDLFSTFTPVHPQIYPSMSRLSRDVRAQRPSLVRHLGHERERDVAPAARQVTQPREIMKGSCARLLKGSHAWRCQAGRRPAATRRRSQRPCPVATAAQINHSSRRPPPAPGY